MKNYEILEKLFVCTNNSKCWLWNQGNEENIGTDTNLEKSTVRAIFNQKQTLVWWQTGVKFGKNQCQISLKMSWKRHDMYEEENTNAVNQLWNSYTSHFTKWWRITSQHYPQIIENKGLEVVICLWKRNFRYFGWNPCNTLFFMVWSFVDSYTHFEVNWNARILPNVTFM